MARRTCVVLCVLAACAGDDRLAPSDLELRDLLGISPDASLGWNAGQRASARHVLDAAMHVRQPTEVALSPSRDVAQALAVADRDRDRHDLGALGVVQLGSSRASSRAATLAPHLEAPFAIEVAGWAEHPGWSRLPERGLDVLASIAWDAGHRSGPVVVSPAPQLAVIAAYLPGSPARLVVNPVLLAALEPTSGSTTIPAAFDSIGNPYVFYASIAECAGAEQTRCDACVAQHACSPLVDGDDGTAECAQLAADAGRGYALACINFALAIDPIATCTAAATSCAFVRDARLDLEKNADFLDRTDCAAALDRCLDERYGSASDATVSTQPASSSSGCSDTAGTACDGAACASDNSDGCDSSSSDSSGCSSDSSGDSCSSSDSSGCSDAGDSGGDCSGGGGSDCNVASASEPHDHHYLWALMPLPFAVIARRRADRRKEVAP